MNEEAKQYNNLLPERKDYLLARFKWFREYMGGKWECWYLDGPVNEQIWFKVKEFSDIREPLFRGIPIREEYSKS